MADYPLPQDTQRAFRTGQAGCRNLGLLFERYTGFGQNWTLEGRDKFEAFKSIVEAAERAQQDTAYQLLIRQHYRRWREAAKAAGALDDCIFEANPDWRFVIGLGRDSVLETGFTFHRVYGFPYIPGSALKGLTQAYALWQVAERLGVPALLPGQEREGDTPIQVLEKLLLEPDPDERRRQLRKLRADNVVPSTARVKSAKADELLAELESDASRYQAVFGTIGARGKVIFFDAVPVEPPTLAVDVMNPHYGDYYQQKPGVPPADYLSPVPVYFLIVQADSRFAFAVAAGDAELASLACRGLKGALENLGTGGKTSAGYGYWTGFEEAAPATVTAAESPELQPPKPSVTPAPIAVGRRTGTVKWFDRQRGYGFIQPDEGGDDVFFHHTQLSGGLTDPPDGTRVSFVMGKGPQGRDQAQDVQPE